MGMIRIWIWRLDLRALDGRNVNDHLILPLQPDCAPERSMVERPGENCGKAMETIEED
jgi:hypothetical protein